MDTVVSIHVAAAAETSERQREQEAAVERALGWFHHVEDTCSRFDPESELAQLSSQVGAAVPVSALLFEAVQFAVAIAGETGGAFDPTVGGRMEAAGFNRDHRTDRCIFEEIDKVVGDGRDHHSHRLRNDDLPKGLSAG